MLNTTQQLSLLPSQISELIISALSTDGCTTTLSSINNNINYCFVSYI